MNVISLNCMHCLAVIIISYSYSLLVSLCRDQTLRALRLGKLQGIWSVAWLGQHADQRGGVPDVLARRPGLPLDVPAREMGPRRDAAVLVALELQPGGVRRGIRVQPFHAHWLNLPGFCFLPPPYWDLQHTRPLSIRYSLSSRLFSSCKTNE